jgi:hypothetical protein
VLLPGQPSALSRAFIVGYRVEAKRYAVAVALHLVNEKRHLVFAHEDAGLDPDGARLAATEAIAFTESMGFFMENIGWKDLDPIAQREMLAGMLVFQPPEGTRDEQPKVIDPRTKLARLLVQF